MRNVALVFLLVEAGLFTVVACSSKDTLPDLPNTAVDSGPVKDTAMSADTEAKGKGREFCNGTLGSYSASVDRCCTAVDKARPEGQAFTSRASGYVASCTAALEAALAKNRIAYNLGDAQTCIGLYLAKYADMTVCPTITLVNPDEPLGPECAKAFSGLGGDDDRCAADFECKDGLTCVGYSGGYDGTCRVPAASGGRCGASRATGGPGVVRLPLGSHPTCAAGNYCDANEFCRPQLPAGGACTRNDQCTSPNRCNSQGQCALQALLPENGRCAATPDCKPELWCDFAANDGGPPGACTGKLSLAAMCGGTSYGQCNGLCEGATTDGGIGACVNFCGSN